MFADLIGWVAPDSRTVLTDTQQGAGNFSSVIPVNTYYTVSAHVSTEHPGCQTSCPSHCEGSRSGDVGDTQGWIFRLKSNNRGPDFSEIREIYSPGEMFERLLTGRWCSAHSAGEETGSFCPASQVSDDKAELERAQREKLFPIR